MSTFQACALRAALSGATAVVGTFHGVLKKGINVSKARLRRAELASTMQGRHHFLLDMA
eukprot:CAMPEP_0179152096 /NCGR_PEP_ID=MMETSP0796-20121207/73897_1 /TAXON_ID=73915 /ORGANISM="Pyrodinium bahamense, Strain pbaha01" /LENGTH=58 /DNA_ID=CAMNT_0020853283 /DNA_START=35 /DNA_END=211 /DNA_ORIENTATION=+